MAGNRAVRHHPDGWKITALNLMAGWTGIGWASAMAWAAQVLPRRP